MSRHDDLPPAVVAAITALLAAIQEPEDEPEDARPWARSGRVAPSWNDRRRHGWRDGERERGWN
ncbi:MAG: hypothetical protein WD628_04070, partial [Thermomicrobiales bacterium]